MLHQETLCLLDYFARRARRGILEIGAYIGGGTTVIAKALVDSGSKIPFATIERGGSKEDPPELPSADILADLRATLAAEGLSDRVTILEGRSYDAHVIAQANEVLRRGIDLLIIDADSNIERHLAGYGHLLDERAIVVFDDYVGANAKVPQVKAWVDAQLAANTVHELAVVKWGTWFGRLNGRRRSTAS